MSSIRAKIIRAFSIVIGALFIISVAFVVLQYTNVQGYEVTASMLTDDYKLLDDTTSLSDAFNSLFKNIDDSASQATYDSLRAEILSIIARRDAQGGNSPTYIGFKNTALAVLEQTDAGLVAIRQGDIAGQQTRYEAANTAVDFVKSTAVEQFVVDLKKLTKNKDYSDKLYLYGLYTGLAALVSSVVASVIYAFYLARKIVDPLDKLTTVAEKLASGNLEATIPGELSMTGDETALLAKSFSLMTNNLKNSISDLVTAKAEVDKKVDERTRELKDERIKLSFQNKLFNSFITNLPIGAVLVNAVTRSIILANSYAQRMLGIPDDAIGDSSNIDYFDLITIYREDGTKYTDKERPLSRSIASGNTISELIFVDSGEGKKVPLRTYYAPVIDAQKMVASVICIYEDFSVQYEIDRAKSELVSLASHQLRTPISSINWYSEMLIKGDAGVVTEQQKEFLNEIYTSSKRMAKLVTTLLDVSRIELGTFAVEPAAVDICAFIEQELKFFKLQINDKKLVIKQNCGQGTTMMVDERVMSIIMQNLISNAIKYTPDEGTITIGVTRDVPTGEFRIAIADSGYGIPKEQQDKIFTKMFRADNVKVMDTDGSGLGLYMVKTIVDKSGCKIWFTSEENKGTTFYIAVPAEGMKRHEGNKRLTELKS